MHVTKSKNIFTGQLIHLAENRPTSDDGNNIAFFIGPVGETITIPPAWNPVLHISYSAPSVVNGASESGHYRISQSPGTFALAVRSNEPPAASHHNHLLRTSRTANF